MAGDTSLNWEYNISCKGINSSSEDVHTGLTTTQATCGGLISGDRYTVTVIAYFTNDVDEVYSGALAKEQAIGKILNLFQTSGNFCCMLITFANSLDPDQDRPNVGSDLDPNSLTLWCS